MQTLAAHWYSLAATIPTVVTMHGKLLHRHFWSCAACTSVYEFACGFSNLVGKMETSMLSAATLFESCVPPGPQNTTSFVQRMLPSCASTLPACKHCAEWMLRFHTLKKYQLNFAAEPLCRTQRCPASAACISRPFAF